MLRSALWITCQNSKYFAGCSLFSWNFMLGDTGYKYTIGLPGSLLSLSISLLLALSCLAVTSLPLSYIVQAASVIHNFLFSGLT